MVWHVPENELAGTPYAITVTTPGASSGPRSTVVTGWPAGWTEFPKIVSATRAGVLLGNLEVTAESGGTLTISGPIDGYADFALAGGDTLDLRPSKLAVTEIHAALDTLDTAVVHLTGNETVDGTKTFADPVTLDAGKLATNVPSGSTNIGFELAAPAYSGSGETLLALTEGGNTRFRVSMPNPFGVPSVELRAGNSGNWFHFYPNDSGTPGLGRTDFYGNTTYFQAAASYFNGDVQILSGHHFYFDDGGAFILGGTVGNFIGTAATQKLAFWGATPIVRPTGDILAALTAAGLVASPTLAAADLTSPAVSPASLSANANDYAPAAGRFYRLTASTPVNITGMVAAADGKERHLWNVGSNAITLTHQDAASTAANRWLTTTGASLVLGANKCAFAVYDATSAAWRVSLLP